MKTQQQYDVCQKITTAFFLFERMREGEKKASFFSSPTGGILLCCRSFEINCNWKQKASSGENHGKVRKMLSIPVEWIRRTSMSWTIWLYGAWLQVDIKLHFISCVWIRWFVCWKCVKYLTFFWRSIVHLYSTHRMTAECSLLPLCVKRRTFYVEGKRIIGIVSSATPRVRQTTLRKLCNVLKNVKFNCCCCPHVWELGNFSGGRDKNSSWNCWIIMFFSCLWNLFFCLVNCWQFDGW